MIHLAALQVPFCRADPPLGARVNVLGTVNVFEAAKARPHLAPITYASSIAAFDANGTMAGHPGTIYGVYKRANESTAAVYFAENGVSSTGLRPHTVYGVGRDQGLTSAPTTAMLAAAAGTAVHDPVRRRRAAPARPRRRARVRRREPRGHARAPPSTTCRAAASRSRRSSPRSAPSRSASTTCGCRSPRSSTAPRSRPASPTSPRRRSPTASRPPSTASAPSSPRASSNPPTARSLMSNSEFPRALAGAVRPRRAEGRVRRPQLRRPHRRVEGGAAEGAAPVRQASRTRSAATATRSCCPTASATSTRRPSSRS